MKMYFCFKRTRLLDNSVRLERMGGNVDRSYQVCIETEEIGGQILNDLHSQRDQINASRNRVKFVNDRAVMVRIRVMYDESWGHIPKKGLIM